MAEPCRPKCITETVGSDDQLCHPLFEEPIATLADQGRWPVHVCPHVWRHYCERWMPRTPSGRLVTISSSAHQNIPLGAKAIERELDELVHLPADMEAEFRANTMRPAEWLGFLGNEQARLAVEATVGQGTTIAAFFLVDWSEYERTENMESSLDALEAWLADRASASRNARNLNGPFSLRSLYSHAQGEDGAHYDLARTGSVSDVVFRVSGPRPNDKAVVQFTKNAREWWAKCGGRILRNQGAGGRKPYVISDDDFVRIRNGTLRAFREDAEQHGEEFIAPTVEDFLSALAPVLGRKPSSSWYFDRCKKLNL